MFTLQIGSHPDTRKRRTMDLKNWRKRRTMDLNYTNFTGKPRPGILFVCTLVCWVALAGVAWPQGFMVKPMKMTLSARPGQKVTQVLEVRNTLPEKALTLVLSLWDMRQGENATWNAIPASTDGTGRSCLPWLSLDTKSIEIKPIETSLVNITLQVPPNARGTYAAGIAVQTQRDPKATGVVMVIRFIVPVIVEIQGPPVRQKVEIADVGMVYSAAGDGKTSQTQISVNVANLGENFPRLKLSVRISRQDGTRWRRVWTEEFEEKGILPDQSVKFTAAPKRNFPSGKYQMEASMIVDGRRMKPLTKEVDYVGDPNAGPLASSINLVMEPQRVECEAVSGARRRAYVTLRNPTDEAVNVTLGVKQVQALQGVMLGETRGDDFSAHAWVSITPPQFTLAKNGKRKVAVQFAFPREGLDKAAYYAILNLTAKHLDGQPAGKMKSLILATNKKVPVKPRMYGQALSLTQTEKNEYSVSATFANVGGVYLEPTCKGTLMDAAGLSAVKTFGMKRDPANLVLPLGTPKWNGSLDFSDVKPGGYTVKVACEYIGGKPGTESFPVKVSDKDGQKQVEIIGAVIKE